MDAILNRLPRHRSKHAGKGLALIKSITTILFEFHNRKFRVEVLHRQHGMAWVAIHYKFVKNTNVILDLIILMAKIWCGSEI